MSYLDNTVAEMKAEIMIAFQYLKKAGTQEEVVSQTEKLEKLIRDNLIQSFKNGIEVGRKERQEKVRKREP